MKYLKVFSLICFSLLCTGGFYYLLSAFESKESPKAAIRLLAQSGPMKCGLKTDHLAELLRLSSDDPCFLLPANAEKILRAYPLIQKVSVSQLNPEILYIDYTLRTPLFSVIDIEKGGMDGEGFLFPLSFSSPKKLPELYLGLKNAPEWGPLPEKERIALAIALLKRLGPHVTRIDVSKILESSLGKREIVAILDNGHTLRLTPNGYEQELKDYEKVKEGIKGIVDLRIPHLAFISDQGS